MQKARGLSTEERLYELEEAMFEQKARNEHMEQELKRRKVVGEGVQEVDEWMVETSAALKLVKRRSLQLEDRLETVTRTLDRIETRMAACECSTCSEAYEEIQTLGNTCAEMQHIVGKLDEAARDAVESSKERTADAMQTIKIVAVVADGLQLVRVPGTPELVVRSVYDTAQSSGRLELTDYILEKTLRAYTADTKCVVAQGSNYVEDGNLPAHVCAERVCVSSCGTRIAAYDWRGRVLVWDLQSGRNTHWFPSRYFVGQIRDVFSLCFTGEYLHATTSSGMYTLDLNRNQVCHNESPQCLTSMYNNGMGRIVAVDALEGVIVLRDTAHLCTKPEMEVALRGCRAVACNGPRLFAVVGRDTRDDTRYEDIEDELVVLDDTTGRVLARHYTVDSESRLVANIGDIVAVAPTMPGTVNVFRFVDGKLIPIERISVAARITCLCFLSCTKLFIGTVQ